eukprot:CAMPEP_0194775750 /NCGR_PEP_ID=MMETSP0323_2-20130528/61195_1 /TAXON_ID=2866 ORGANISM="Crypthecodinium cohnii, Strain Seligo" /NCGR_SAMPLE_ID=MMETSP0323_2 /ASSEMBLY_ACC=CAM_ASM_000346 /LENGTH=115 /DNA_ID=CAMNT_0039711855 /DNA_START=389 /DNA_END=736 /DNA_ORIENTATION=-
MMPTAQACSLPSASTCTGVSFSTFSIRPPALVNPGHMMLAPLRTNLIAPVSTRTLGIMEGYWWSTLRVGIQGPSLCWKKMGTLSTTTIETWSLHFAKTMFPSLGQMSFITGSSLG